MFKSLKWRALLIIAITAFSIWKLYPPKEKIHLGLDLQGGMHVVLEVQIDEAVDFDVKRIQHDVQATLEAKDIHARHIEQIGLKQIKIEFAQANDKSQAAKLIKKSFPSLDLMSSDEKRIDYILETSYEEQLRNRALRQAKEIILNRIDKFGVSEPSIQTQGDRRIIVQLPGVQDMSRAESLLQQTAQLEFRLVSEDEEKLKEALEGNPPPGYEVLYMEFKREGRSDRIPMLVKKIAELTGSSLKDARPTFDPQFNSPTVSFELDKQGAKIFAEVTRNNIERPLAIVLDGSIVSAPKINSEIPNGSGVITGKFTPDEAKDLAVVLTSGALPAPVKKIQDMRVGPSLGSDSIQQGLYAGIGGMIGVCVFMVLYYWFGGLIANIALALNVVIVLGALAMLQATLTLPGIAGIILTIGMAVDANVLIFERIREELQLGKRLKNAIDAGYKRAVVTITDANITTFLTALILYQFGTGPIRGFAVTLMIGILSSMFTAIVLTRFIYDLLTANTSMKTMPMLQLFGKTSIPFVKIRKFAFAISGVLIVGGIVCFGMRGSKNFGVDFTGGDILQVKFNQEVPLKDIRKSMDEIGQSDAMIQNFGNTHEILIRSKYGSDAAIMDKLNEDFKDLGVEERRREEIGPAIGKDLRTNATKAMILALIVILIYIAWRFEFEYALGAIIALLHDVIITLGAFAVSGRELSLPMIAALLTIVGYSLNDTIVICDRVRENIKSMRKSNLTDIINASINQTISRTLLTSLTTLFVVVTLYLFGGTVINDFAFALFVGVVVGTYSSIFVACPIVLVWKENKLAKIEQLRTKKTKTSRKKVATKS